jgi:integration host factor subunit beta
VFTVEALHREPERLTARDHEETGPVTKKEIVKQISERIGLTQLKTKEIVQQTFDAIVETLLEVGRIELRNFGVFEVKQRKARKARNPRTGDKVDVPPKNVVTFKPGKEMEEKVRKMAHLPNLATVGDDEDDVGVEVEVETAAAGASNGAEHDGADHAKARSRSRKTV